MSSKIQWRAWGEEALEQARAEDKPILLDIGATWCHWCHVMDRTTYSDAEVVGLVEERFVPVRVDTDARPDINARYNRGGWPTTAFLTPDGTLLGGGTYFPPAQMKLILLEYSSFYSENKDVIREKVQETSARRNARAAQREPTDEVGIDNGVVERAVEDIWEHADLQHGGFGRAPKFPHPEPIALALLWHRTRHDRRMLDFAKVTLDSMAKGGIHDHIGGGFHRYAVDGNWHVPHFEKLLDVNAGMLSAYIAGYRALNDDRYRQVADGILSFLEGVLAAPGGCFYASQDADTYEGDDGSHFTWTVDEIRQALPQDLAGAVTAFYGVEPKGDVDTTPGRNVLHQTMTCEQFGERFGMSVAEATAAVARAKAALSQVRGRRRRPSVDQKIITNWNCLAARAYFDAGEAFGRTEHRQRALDIVDFLTRRCVDPSGGAYHYMQDDTLSVHGLLCDQAALANACLDAYEATGNRAYLRGARELVGFTAGALASPSGGYVDAPPAAAGGGDVPAETGTIYDNAEAARALARLHMFTGKTRYQDDARTTLAALLPEFEGTGYLAAGYAIAADLLVNYPVELVTIGPPHSPQTRALHEASLRLYEPRRMVQLLDPETDGDLLEAKGYAPPGRPALFVCVNATCSPPVHSPEQLREIYERFVGAAAAV